MRPDHPWAPPDWRGRRSFTEPVNWHRLPEFDVGIALVRHKQSYGWDNRWFLYVRSFNDTDVIAFPVFSQTVITTSPGLTQSITSDATWVNTANFIDVIGAGGSGAHGSGVSASGGGGGGGGHARIINVTIPSPGTTVYRARVGLGGTEASAAALQGGDSWWDLGAGSPDIFPTAGVAVGARGGRGPTTTASPDVQSVTGAFGGQGGLAALAYRGFASPDLSMAHSGGKGGDAPAATSSGGGGGGAAGDDAPGSDGGAGPGAGGIGNRVGSPDQDGGLGGAVGSPGGAGGAGLNFDGVRGSGGGGGGGNANPSTGGRGGLYGGGGGGGGRSTGVGGAGENGIVILNWTPAATPSLMFDPTFSFRHMIIR